MSLVKNKLIKGIAIGGLCSIISVDVSEIVFSCLDPVVKYGSKKLPIPGGNAANAVFQETSPTLSNQRKLEKEKKKKKQRRILYKRVLRILLFTFIAYLMVTYLVSS